MRAVVHVAIAAVLLLAVLAVAGFLYVKSTGLRGQPTPGSVETRVARTIRGLAIPSDRKARTNPLATANALAPGLEHFARYCAMCHANDGSGENAPLGKGLYPKPPDLRHTTEGLTDGELFYTIENGVRFTGMPAFGTGMPDPAGDTQVWQLVSFIRHLPQISSKEIEKMKTLNPL